MAEFFSQPDDFGELRASDLHSSLGDTLSAQAGEALFGTTRTLYRNLRYAAARGTAPVVPEMGNISGEDPAASAEPEPDIPIADAKARVKQAGLEGTFQLPEQETIKEPVLDLMMSHAQERRDYQATLARGPQGFIPDALGFVTSIGAGLIDPLGVAAFTIPVVGEARLGMMMKAAGEGVLARAGVRGLVGAGQGAVGTAALAPNDWWLHTNDGIDYTMSDVLHSVIMGAGMGAVLHAGFGALRDRGDRRAGRPLEGSVDDLIARGLMQGTKIPDRVLEAPAIPERPHPAEVLSDLPPRVREDVVRSAIADVIQDKPVRAAELLQEAAKEDPRIAESVDPYFEAFHGSPHDFERFDVSRIGTGEGQQTYGRGLYFAENERVADFYRKSVSEIGQGARAIYGHDAADEAIYWLHEAKKDRAKAKQLYLNHAREVGDDIESPDYVQAVVKVLDGGNLYKVRISANRDRFLDWDKPISEQPEVRERLQQAYRDQGIKHFMLTDTVTGGEAYQGLARLIGEGKRTADHIEGAPITDHEAASAALRDVGIPGIRYLDSGSRDVTGNGEKVTSNFVVFDDRHVTITHKNGEEVRLMGLKADWSRLSDDRLAVVDRDLIEASEAAAKAPEPPVEPEKAVSAAEAAAKDADKLLSDILPQLSEKERKAFEEVLEKVGHDKALAETLVRDGTACLLEAIG